MHHVQNNNNVFEIQMIVDKNSHFQWTNLWFSLRNIGISFWQPFRPCCYWINLFFFLHTHTQKKTLTVNLFPDFFVVVLFIPIPVLVVLMKISQCFLIWFIETLNVIGAMYRNFYFCMSVCVCMCVDVLFFPVLFPDLFFSFVPGTYSFFCFSLFWFVFFRPISYDASDGNLMTKTMTTTTMMTTTVILTVPVCLPRDHYTNRPIKYQTDDERVNTAQFTQIHIHRHTHREKPVCPWKKRRWKESNKKKRKKIWLVCLVCLVVWLHIIVDDKSDEGVYHSHFHIILGELFK